MSAPASPNYDDWLRELRALAKQHDCEPLVSREPGAHRGAFDKGLTPDQELFELQDMAQWRGCGCGGNS